MQLISGITFLKIFLCQMSTVQMCDMLTSIYSNCFKKCWTFKHGCTFKVRGIKIEHTLTLNDGNLDDAAFCEAYALWHIPSSS